MSGMFCLTIIVLKWCFIADDLLQSLFFIAIDWFPIFTDARQGSASCPTGGIIRIWWNRQREPADRGDIQWYLEGPGEAALLSTSCEAQKWRGWYLEGGGQSSPDSMLEDPTQGRFPWRDTFSWASGLLALEVLPSNVLAYDLAR